MMMIQKKSAANRVGENQQALNVAFASPGLSDESIPAPGFGSNSASAVKMRWRCRGRSRMEYRPTTSAVG